MCLYACATVFLTSKSQKQNVDSVQHDGVSLAEISRDPVHQNENTLASRDNVTDYIQQNGDRHRRAKNDTGDYKHVSKAG